MYDSLETLGAIKMVLLTLILLVLLGVIGPSRERMIDLPQSAAETVQQGNAWYRSAFDNVYATDMPTIGGNSNTTKNGFSGEAPVYYPMADEAYLNKYLYGMDPQSMTPAAIAAVESPIFQRLNTPGTGAYTGLGDKGVYQLTNDLLVAKNLGAGQCASGQWVGDVSACPEAVAQLAPGPESFSSWEGYSITPNTV